ncbi:MAG TPA: cation diffusion facilitator family transporter [Candidatus Acidoferrales bacterium]|nr:cation diffusion facilitator family transporter [Candidatus Acidoferrales bacterium]
MLPDKGQRTGMYAPDLSRSGSEHELPPGADRRYIYGALGLIVAFMVFEVIAAVVAGSLALLADAGHMLTDVGALAGVLWASHLAARPSSDRFSFGLKRAEVLAAAINGVTLLVVAVLVGVDAVSHLVSPRPVHGVVLLIVAGVGVVVNLAAVRILARANRLSMSLRGASAHVLTDLYAFIATVVAGAVILEFGFQRADSIASLIVVVLMLRAAAGLLVESGRILLEGTPESVDLDLVRRHLTALPDVLAVHEVHAWTLTSNLPVVSAHVIVSDACLSDGTSGKVIDQLQECLAGHFDVEHSTFQLEPATHADHELPQHG